MDARTGLGDGFQFKMDLERSGRAKDFAGPALSFGGSEVRYSNMKSLHVEIGVRTPRQGLHEVTELVAREVAKSGLRSGIVNIFCRHTSCSLVIMENADPTARADLEAWLNRLVPESDPHFEHTLEGPDDMPSHIKMALTRTSETVPFADGRMLLGTWQGIYLWEHRRHPHTRTLVVTILGDM